MLRTGNVDQDRKGSYSTEHADIYMAITIFTLPDTLNTDICVLRIEIHIPH